MRESFRTKAELLAEISTLKKKNRELGKFKSECLRAGKNPPVGEDLYRTALESSNDGIAVTQRGRYVYVNQPFLDSIGRQREDVMHSRYGSYVHPDDRPMVLDYYLKRKKGLPTAQRFETRLVLPDGGIKHVYVSLAAVTYQGKKSFLLYAQDITDRKKAEEGLRDSEARYRTIVENTNDAIFIVDFAKNIIEVNGNACRMFGYKRRELVGANLARLDPEGLLTTPTGDGRQHDEHERLLVNRKWERLLQKRSVVIEHNSRRRDGSAITVEISARVSCYDGRNAVTAFVRDVTERKKMQMALQESDERFKALFDGSRDNVFIRDLAGNIYDMNQAALDMLGYSREEIRSINIFALLVEEDHLKARKQSDNLLLTGLQQKPVEYRVRCKDGSLVDVENKSSLVYRDRKPYAVVGISRDITERKKMEAALRESDERFKAVFEGSLDGVYIHDLNGKLLDINQAALDKLGYTRAEMMSLDLSSMFDEKEIGKTLQLREELLQTGLQHEPAEFRIKCKDGSHTDAEIKSSIVCRDGRPYAVVGISRDITERKKMEAALRESDERFKAVFDHSLDGVFIHDFSGNVLDLNQAALDKLGYTLQEIKDLRFISLLDENQQIKSRQVMDELRRTGVQKKPSEYKVRTKDGSCLYVENKSSVVYRDGRPLAIVGISRDITERKKAEKELQKLVASLQKALEEIKTLKGIVPICAKCKKIRDDTGYWEQVEAYVSRHTEAQFSHGICPDCMKGLYPDLYVE